jgi:hypothetical protein
MTRDIRPQGRHYRGVRAWASPAKAKRAYTLASIALDAITIVSFFGIGLCVVACIHG